MLRAQLRPSIRALGIAGSQAHRWDLRHHLRPRVHEPIRRSDGLLVPVRGPIAAAAQRALPARFRRPAPMPPATSFLCGSITTRHLFRDRKWWVVTRPQTHTCVIGPSGVGKGVSAMLPPLLAQSGEDGLGWPGPIVASSAKGDLLLPTIAWRKSRGKVFIWSPLGQDLGEAVNELGAGCWVGWDPVADATSADAASRTARLFIPDGTDGGEGQNSKHFASRAQQVLAPLLRAANLSGENIDRVVSAIADLSQGATGCTALGWAKEWLDGSGAKSDGAMAQQLLAVNAADAGERSGAMGTASRAVEAFQDARGARVAGARIPGQAPPPPVFDISEFLSGPNTLYVVSPADPADTALVRPVVTAFLGRIQAAAGQLARDSGGALALPLLPLLDECSAVGALSDLPVQLAVSRSLNIAIRHSWQDLAQMKAGYGQLAGSVTTNSQCLLVFPGSTDPAVLELGAQLAGQGEAESRSVSIAPDRADNSESIGTQSAPVLPAAALRQLRKDEILMFADTRPPVLIRQAAYFSDPVMSARSGNPVRQAHWVVRGLLALPRALAGWLGGPE